MDVSIILVNYNTISFLVDTISSVFLKTEDIEYEIIVVDNNSSDNSRVILAEKYGDKVIYLGLVENIGFGRANNEGVKIARGRNLFFLNPDTILLNNAVKILSDYLDSNIHVGCCGGNLINFEGEPTYSFTRVRFMSIFYEIDKIFLRIPSKLLYGKNYYYNYTNKPLRVNSIIGADLMIRKELFDKLHGFDPSFFMYHEESELEYRVKKAGYEIISVPYAQIIHLEGKSFSNNFIKLKKILASRKIYLQKTYNPISIMIINSVYFLNVAIRLLVFTILWKTDEMRKCSNILKQVF